ncbi:ATP-binding cassette domain-containing protein, partial [Lactococcus sp. UBA7220]
KVKNLYQGQKVVIPFLETSISKGIITNIVGKNGIGKSSFLSALNGELRVEEFTASIGTEKIDVKKNFEIVKLTSDFFGYEFLKSIEFVEYILRLYRREIKSNMEVSQKMMEDLSMKEFEYTLVKNLSQGTKQKLAFIATVLASCKIMLFDEAFEHIDRKSLQEIFRILDMVRKESYILNVSHTGILDDLENVKLDLEGLISYEN